MRQSIAILTIATIVGPLSADDILPGVKKIVFLGDSITHSGQYISYFETQLRLKEPKRTIEILNLGLPSETVSGLSEEGHAGGKFPRPNLHERLDRVLKKTRPDAIIACYGMNDGIYLPLDDARFTKFKDGLKRLRLAAGEANAVMIHLTPAVFDPVPIKNRLAAADKVDANHPFEGYGKVLDAYSDWLIEQRKNQWTVIDLHGPMQKMLDAWRMKKLGFTYAGDGVHPNLDGQIVLGESLCRGIGIEPGKGSDVKTPDSKAGKLFRLIEQRSQVLRDAWLTETGHKRPLAAGLPLDQAKTKAAEIDAKIGKLLQ